MGEVPWDGGRICVVHSGDVWSTVPSFGYGGCLSRVEQNGWSFAYMLASYLLIHVEREDEVGHSLVNSFSFWDRTSLDMWGSYTRQQVDIIHCCSADSIQDRLDHGSKHWPTPDWGCILNYSVVEKHKTMPRSGPVPQLILANFLRMLFLSPAFAFVLAMWSSVYLSVMLDCSPTYKDHVAVVKSTSNLFMFL